MAAACLGWAARRLWTGAYTHATQPSDDSAHHSSLCTLPALNDSHRSATRRQAVVLPPSPPRSRSSAAPWSVRAALASVFPSLSPRKRRRKDPRTAASVTPGWEAAYSAERLKTVAPRSTGKRVSFSETSMRRTFIRGRPPVRVALLRDEVFKTFKPMAAIREAVARLYHKVCGLCDCGRSRRWVLATEAKHCRIDGLTRNHNRLTHAHSR